MGKVMVIDLTKCVGCYNCQIACKDEFTENDWPPYSLAQPETGQFWMNVPELIQGQNPKVRVNYVPQPCMHCDDAPCMDAATGGAIYKRPDGIVIIDPVKAAGQKQLVASCPYGAIYWNDQLNIPQKCTMCAHLLDKGWTAPRCVEVCQGYAITFGEEADLKAMIQTSNAVPMRPELGTEPRVYYVGLPRPFIAGALVDSKTGECVKDAQVTATDDKGNQVATATSDFLGDFWLNGLTLTSEGDPYALSGTARQYTVTISKGNNTKTIAVTLDRAQNLGDIQFP
jgi:tetrathionate reductase subunit B